MAENFFSHSRNREAADKQFIWYLLSFATAHCKEDASLTACAKELIRYILGVDDSENIVVTTIGDYSITVNNSKEICFSNHSGDPFIKSKENEYCVRYNPNGTFTMGKQQLYLTRKKLLEIFNKHPSENLIYNQYIQHLCDLDAAMKEQAKLGENGDCVKQLVEQLMEDSIIDVSRGVRCTQYYDNDNVRLVGSFYWYFITSESLTRKRSKKEPKICLCAENNMIRVCFDETEKRQTEKMESFINSICPTPITFDSNNYKEKFKYAQSIMDRLEAEFRI